jgi:hypothetical protein
LVAAPSPVYLPSVLPQPGLKKTHIKIRKIL